MALRLWNANKELERLVKMHSEALAAYGSEADSQQQQQVQERRPVRSITPTPVRNSIERPLTPSPESRTRTRYVELRRESSASSVTELVLADMETSSSNAGSSSGSVLSSFFEDDFEPLDPYMQLPHPVTRSPSVCCY